MIGKDVSKATSVSEAMEIAGLDYKLGLKKIYLQSLAKVDGIPVIGKQVPNRFAVVREDNGQAIGTVGNRYKIVQNAECFSFFDGLIEQGLAKFERAYSTHNGAKVNVVADLGDFYPAGDKSRKQLILRTSHDGTGSISVFYIAFRLSCTNQLNGAERKAFKVKIRHTASFNTKLHQAREVMGISDQYYRWFEEQAGKLTNKAINHSDANKLIKIILPAKDKENISVRLQNQWCDILYLHKYGKGNNGKTAWDLYNGVTEYVDHHRSNRNAEKVAESILVGSGARLKQKAFETLLTVC